MAHSSYGNLQEGAKNLLHACLISDPEIVESRLALADTCFDKMKQELSDLKSTSFADISANVVTIEEVEAENAAAMYKASQITKYICIIILVMAGALSILIGRNVAAILSKALNSSTSELQAASVQMASGNFDVSINYTSEDELGGLAEGDFTVQTEMEEKYVGIYETLKIPCRI